MKRLLILPLSLTLVGFVTSSCSSSASKDKERNDSIAAEAARLDSIRQDSIARRNFITPDLAFNDLHGDVKTCRVKSSNSPSGYSEIFTYDENGKWTNEPVWDEYDKENMPETTKHRKVERNAEGYIIRIYNDYGASCEYESVIWESGKVKTNSISTYKYDNDGLAISREDIREYDSGTDGAVYCNYVLDNMGNWVKRDVIYKFYSIGINDDERIEYSKSTETREITYYKSNNGGSAQRPNNTIQGQALQNLRDFAQQKEQDEKKGPEWIQGSWELTINSPYGAIATYHLTINGQNAHLVEGNKDKYNGRYEIKDGQMIVGPRKYDINDQYQRLEYAQYRWHKISGGSNHQAYQGRNSSFSSASDVMRYLSGRTFYNSGDGLRIDYNAVYLNGTALTGAPRVVDISGNSATVVANSPYSGGGTLRFYVNSANGTVTQSGDVYRER